MMWRTQRPCAKLRSNVAIHKDRAMTAPQTLQVIPASAYAGDIPAPLAWHWVQTGEAVLIDVRTDAERAWVGQVPGAVPVQWKL